VLEAYQRKEGEVSAMQIVVCVVSVLFGALSLVASVSQMKNERKPFPGVLMSSGSVLLLAAVAACLCGWGLDWALAVMGCVGICAAAMWNGIQSRSLHVQHHVVRIALSVLLVVGFVIW